MNQLFLRINYLKRGFLNSCQNYFTYLIYLFLGRLSEPSAGGRNCSTTSAN